MEYDAHQSILNIIGGQYLERWPDEERQIILYTAKFTYRQRLAACTFLYGNMRDAGLVYKAIRQQIGADAKDHNHAAWSSIFVMLTTRTASSSIWRAASTT